MKSCLRLLLAVRALSVGLAFGLFSGMSVVLAQQHGSSPCGEDYDFVAARMILGRFCEIAKEPAIIAASGGKSGPELLSFMPPDILRRLSDDDLQLFIKAYALALQHEDPTTCGLLVDKGTKWTQDFVAIAPRFDAATSEIWTPFQPMALAP